MPPKVSILVPVYNVSCYIERCAHSLFQQTFDDIEYIFVNDCTQDNSIELLQKIIEQYPVRKPNVKIIHHETNRGLAAARNTAIDHSTGAYIQVVDSDDWIDTDMVELMYRKAIEETADVVMCDIYIERKDCTEIFASKLFDNKDEDFLAIMEGKIFSSLWNKLVKRNLFEMPETRVPEGLNHGEDQHVICRIFFYAQLVVQIQKACYHYVTYNQGSLTKKITEENIDNFILKWNLFDDFFKKESLEKGNRINQLKVTEKARFLLLTPTRLLRKKLTYLYRDIELKYLNNLRLGEKMIIIFTHFKLHFLADWTIRLIRWKNKKYQ